MPGIKATGIIIKQTEFGETNRMLSIFTKEFGIISASVYGAKSIKSSKGAASQFLCFAEFELSKGNSALYTVYSATAVESFYPIYEDIEKLALASYLCDITYFALGSGNKDEKVLSLLLNTLYALAYNNISLNKAKCVYELKLMSYTGYTPVLAKCVKCGNTKDLVGFSQAYGGLMCSKCNANATVITKSALDAMNYIVLCDNKKIFSFSITEKLLSVIGKITEEFVRQQLDMDFASLAYLKKIMIWE